MTTGFEETGKLQPVLGSFLPIGLTYGASSIKWALYQESLIFQSKAVGSIALFKGRHIALFAKHYNRKGLPRNFIIFLMPL
jgi:hypothetical protein